MESIRIHTESSAQRFDFPPFNQKDLKEGYGETLLPFALSKKYPNAGKEWIWQYVFPASLRSTDPEAGMVRRHHLHPSAVQKAVRRTAQKV
jgi:hypothetical protein